jgi:hypothetical protein
MKRLTVIGICCVASSVAGIVLAAEAKRPAKSPAVVAVSKDGDSILRVVRGDAQRKAKALTFRFDAANETFVAAGSLELRNPIAPEMIFVVDGGRYVVTLDDLNKVGLTENAVVIYDLQANTSRAFAIEDFLPPDVIDSLGSAMGMRAWRGWPALDSSALKLYPSGVTQDPNDPPFPHVIIDIANMSVTLGSR